MATNSTRNERVPFRKITKIMTSEEKHEKNDEIKHALTGEAFTDHREIHMAKVYHPIHISMTIFGLLWQGKANMLRRKFNLFDLHTLHCCLVLLSVWINAIRYFASYDGSDTYGTPLFKQICTNIVQLQIAFGITSNVYFKHKHVPPFVLLLENYKLRHGGLPLTLMSKFLLKRVVFINLTVIIVSLVTIIIGIIKTPELFVDYYFPIAKRMHISVPFWFVILHTIWIVYLELSWLQALIFCFCTNKIMKEEFKQLSVEFDEELCKETTFTSRFTTNPMIPETHVSSPDSVRTEKYRLRYQELCNLVSRYDDVISSFLLFLYLCSLPIIIFLLYAVSGFDDSRSEESPVEFLFSAITLMFFVFIIVSVTTSSSSLSAAVRTSRSITQIF